MKFYKIFFLSLLMLGFSACDNDDDEGLDQFFTTQFSALNESGVSGTADIVLNGNILTVTINANGMVPNQQHPQHIHGFDNSSQNSTCPSPTADEDGDGIVSVGEGAPFYGGILLPLEQFPQAGDNGTIFYQQTFVLGENGNPSRSELGPLENRTIVLHGRNVDGEYVPTVPVACGQLNENF